MPRWAFHDLLGEVGIQRRYDMEELEEDLKTLEELKKAQVPVMKRIWENGEDDIWNEL